MVIVQGEVWWADSGDPIGSAPSLKRPVVIVQCDGMNRSRIGSVVFVRLTSNLKWGNASGNLLLKAKLTGLHVAIAAFHGVEYLVTWNCRHIANAHELPRIYGVLEREGLGNILICTPAEFLGGDADDKETTDS
jgi:mRNA-degrading endonuclease toxin of MazEF toxin-antitoxin module